MSNDADLDPLCRDGPDNIWTLFHKTWGQAKESLEYDKEVLKLLEAKILKLQRLAKERQR